MTQKPFRLLSIALAFVFSACGPPLTNPNTGTITPDFFTATWPASSTPDPTQTLAPPTAVPTLPPIEGTTTTHVNVRAETSTSSAALGMILPSTKVHVMGKDASGTWYKLVYPESPQGQGWVLATYVQVASGAEIPVISVGSASGSSASVLILQQVYVRSGPGTQFDSLGILSPNDVVALSGKDSSGSWLQIEYTAAPEGKGWISAQFARANGADTVALIDASSTPVSTETPFAPSLSPAFDDGDSVETPSITVAFTPTGTRALHFSSDVSAPEGDRADWVRFTPYGEQILVHITCSGHGALFIEVSTNGAIMENNAACAESHIWTVQPGQAYFIRLSADTNQQTLIHYTLRIEQLP